MVILQIFALGGAMFPEGDGDSQDALRAHYKHWCAREDLNLHPLRDQILSLACLPFHHSRLRTPRPKMPAPNPNLKQKLPRLAIGCKIAPPPFFATTRGSSFLRFLAMETRFCAPSFKALSKDLVVLWRFPSAAL